LIECPNCSRMVDEDAQICDFCGKLLIDDEANSTKTLEDTDYEDTVPKWGTARFNGRMNLVVRLRDANANFVYDAGGIEELVIGRLDPNTGEGPDIDLHDYGGTHKGVSRRHAAIVRRDGALNLVDQGSPNGTFLNGQRLIPHQPRILRDGDDIRLGHLVLQIRFERVIDRA
jgi:hypothetical protein